MGQDGASVTGEAAQRQLWGPRIGHAAAFQNGMLTKVFTDIKDMVYWVSHCFRQCPAPPSIHSENLFDKGLHESSILVDV